MRFVAALLSIAAMAAADGYRLLKRIPIPGDYGWDYLAVDDTSRRLYVSHDRPSAAGYGSGGFLSWSLAGKQRYMDILFAVGGQFGYIELLVFEDLFQCAI